MLFNEKVAIVTGAAQGIGLAIATDLAKKGAKVAIADINEDMVRVQENIMTTQGLNVKSYYVDVSSVQNMGDMVKSVVNDFDHLDILVNNAGVLSNVKIQDLTEQEWDRVMAINLKSVVFGVKTALPYLIKSKNPRIINISSLAGRMGGYETGLAYTASKGGIISLTYGLARQLASYGITVNCVCPGTTQTEIISKWDKEKIDSLIDRIPLGKLGKPENIASAVSYLASDEAEYITGLVMDVNGGMYFG